LDRKITHLSGLALNVISPSRFLAARVTQSRVGRQWHVHHVPNGVSPAAFGFARKRDRVFRQSLGLDPSAIVVLVVNRNFSDPQKGFSVVRDALGALTPTLLPVQVVLAGEGSDAAALGLPPEVRPTSLGSIESTEPMAALYEASDVFLFASPAENFPCVILEAMASGCCIVATPTSGVTEQLENGATGVLATSMDGLDLGRALLSAVQNADLRRVLGEAARARISKEFSLDLMIKRHAQIYDAAAREHVG
jgi:glycosyltransferase involved in cell wall biosynthesis